MEKYERITDAEAFQVVDELMKNESADERIITDALVVKLKLLIDIRQFLRKIYQNMPKKSKVYTRPTNNKNDIIVGEK